MADRGVGYSDHQIRSQVTPYGQCAPFNKDAFLRGVKAFKCEFLRRPAVGLSELSASTIDNAKYVAEEFNDTKEEIMAFLPQTAIQGFMDDNTMDKILDGVLEMSAECEHEMKDMFRQGNAMMIMAFHILEFRAFIDNPGTVAGKVEQVVAVKYPQFTATPSTENFLAFIKNIRSVPRSYYSKRTGDDSKLKELREQLSNQSKQIEELTQMFQAQEEQRKKKKAKKKKRKNKELAKKQRVQEASCTQSVAPKKQQPEKLPTEEQSSNVEKVVKKKKKKASM